MRFAALAFAAVAIVARRSFARLTVYNILGKEIRTLVSAELSAGVHTIRWDASNYASGMYFYRLESGSLVETKKLVLLH